MKTASNLLFIAFTAIASFGFVGAALADSKPCPPGLAKKEPPCVPPGQARKGVTSEEWQNRHGEGDVIDGVDTTYLDDYWKYDLPRLPAGQRYAVVDDQVVVIDRESYEILQFIRLFQVLGD